MKRAGKCVNKKPFPHLLKAEAQVIKNYCLGKKAYGIYECPTCLDFHLTSLYDNRSAELRTKCRKVKNQFHIKQEIDSTCAMKWLHKKANAHANPKLKKPKKLKKKLLPPDPNSKSQIAKRKKQEYKKFLPLAEQKRILAELDKKKLSTPKSFWSRILDIIRYKRE